MGLRKNKKEILIVVIILFLILNLLVIYFKSNKKNLKEVNCKEFKEQILWSSGYSKNKEGSTNYKLWTPKVDCTETGFKDCFIGNVELKTRFVSLGENDELGEGYVQISEPDESVCKNPEKGTYLKYLAYDALSGESQKIGLYCGSNKNPDEKCGIDFSNKFKNKLMCYGIKSHATKDFLVDVIEIKYVMCGEKNE